jgi:hypothetical protein
LLLILSRNPKAGPGFPTLLAAVMILVGWLFFRSSHFRRCRGKKKKKKSEEKTQPIDRLELERGKYKLHPNPSLYINEQRLTVY